MSWSRILPEASTLGGAVGLEQMLTGPFGDDHDGVVTVVEPSFEGGQEAGLAVQRERTLGDQDKVRFLAARVAMQAM